MKINLTGCTRIVFEFKNVVIKIPKPVFWSHFLTGLISNMAENKTWKWNSGKYERGKSYLLCPVIWSSWGGWILIMKKVDRVLDWDEDNKYDLSEHIKHFPGDDKVKNYGLLKGQIVKIDYGQ